jgi:DNA repair exonuclease SbcCD ATPase subunit
VLTSLCSIDFRHPVDVNRLLSSVSARACYSTEGGNPSRTVRRTAELAGRRDALAQELESRIAGERRVSKELEARWRELDRLVRDEQQQVNSLEQRVNSIETSLAETDARLRYRRLELNVEPKWQTAASCDMQPRLAELDEQLVHWRKILAELAQREANVRAQAAQLESSRTTVALAAGEQQTWLAMTRQLSTDLSGEVARLTRASASKQCVCGDSHPRLRPIAETIERQLNVLETVLDQQNRALAATELLMEADHLAASQVGLRRQVDHLLDRRQAITRTAAPPCDDASGTPTAFSVADAQQLESRRLELEQERGEVVERLRTHSRLLRDLRAQRETVDRQRAALLSARSIEHVQRELADVQQKLERAANGATQAEGVAILDDTSSRASDFLAQLTNGDLVQLVLGESGTSTSVVNREGTSVPFETLGTTECCLVYLSLCLSLLKATSRQGIWLPLILDEPFELLDSRGAAALAAVLDDFCRQGHQVLVFTGQRPAVERLASVGSEVHDILSLRQQPETQLPSSSAAPSSPVIAKKRKSRSRIANNRKRATEAPHHPLNGESPDADRSDAA